MERKIIQITAGKGPVECQWVVVQVTKELKDDAKANDVETRVLTRVKGELKNTLLSISILVSGKDIDGFLKSWLGVIQWTGKSNLRKNVKRKNWFVGIYELQNIAKPKFSKKDVEVQVFRSSGAGGQHVNKTNSAVRIIHLKTGTAVVASNRRSQVQNKKEALKRLEAKLYERIIEKQSIETKSDWTNHLNLERGNAIRTFSGNISKVKKEKKKKFKTQRAKNKEDARNEIKNARDDH